MKRQEGAPGRRELKPAAWFQERLAEWQRRMGLGAWTLRVIKDMVPRKIQRDARDFLRPHEESVVEAIAHALVRTADVERSNRIVQPQPSTVAQAQTKETAGTPVAAGSKPETAKPGEG